MKLCLRFPRPTPAPLFHASKKRRNGVFNCKVEDDKFFQAAMHRSLRFPGDPSSRKGCLIRISTAQILYSQTHTSDAFCQLILKMDVSQTLHKHCLATKFIDDKLLSTMKKDDGLRQVVLLTDGMDTGLYRLNWPASTILFDISPDRIFRRSIQKLEDVGASIPRRSLLFHVPSETSDIQQVLRSKGYNGARPSLWVFQGYPIITLANFKDILGIVSTLAMKGCCFFGEMPSWLVETEIGIKSTMRTWMDKLFMSHGLRVEIIEYDKVARNLKKESSSDDYENILFVAEQLQFSDDQMEIWRREFQRIEDEGDEEGFEEL